MTDWTSDANKALTLRLVHAPEDTSDDDVATLPFHPRFTYPIFGDEEKIYGYRDLSIDLSFASGSLSMNLSIKHSAKLPASTADDIEGTLYKFIPSDYLRNQESFMKVVEKDAREFKPPGEKVASYRRNRKGKGKVDGEGRENVADEEEGEDESVFEAYYCTWLTPGFRDLHRRMQLFILLYIEAGSYIQEDEDKWEFLVLYERRRRKDATFTYHFVGYTSMYPFFCFPDKVRMRLSQFVILGPYQGRGHGAALYSALHTYILSNPIIAELAVEDPGEAFEDLRDKVDLKFLLSHHQFIGEAYGEEVNAKGKGKGKGGLGKLSPPADKEWVERWRKELKMATRQFERLMEMLILRRLDPMDPNALKAYRLQVKERLYRFNFEILVTLEKEERLEKLEETFESVVEGYQGILGQMEG